LYYKKTESRLEFASEVRLLIDASSLKINREVLANYLRFGAIDEEMLYHLGINSVPPAHILTIRHNGTQVLERFWALDIPAKRPTPSMDVVGSVRSHLERSIGEHLLSDVPICCFLSGGIDSSVVTAIAAKISSRRITTVSVGFADRRFDETAVASIVARRYNTEHHHIQLSDDEVLSAVEQAVSKMDLPSVDAINTYIVCQQTAQLGVKVALSGLGGDEFFGAIVVSANCLY
jgi:asparagine synthase (glutamine-hydrolysing)